MHRCKVNMLIYVCTDGCQYHSAHSDVGAKSAWCRLFSIFFLAATIGMAAHRTLWEALAALELCVRPKLPNYICFAAISYVEREVDYGKSAAIRHATKLLRTQPRDFFRVFLVKVYGGAQHCTAGALSDTTSFDVCFVILRWKTGKPATVCSC